MVLDFISKFYLTLNEMGLYGKVKFVNYILDFGMPLSFIANLVK